MLVLARLLHKSLAQSPGDTSSPFVESLRARLGSLRRRVLVHIDRRLASSDADAGALVEAMCAFSLATSSGPRDVLRHFLHVRREAVLVRLGKDEGDESVLVSLKIYVRTLQDTQTLFPKRLAEGLVELKARPLLKDRDVRALVELNLDVHERWMADEVRNFTPWVRHEDLQKIEAGRVLEEWARTVFAGFVDGLMGMLGGVEDLGRLISLRKDLLETWLAADIPSAASSSGDLFAGLRSAINTQLSRVIRNRVEALLELGSEVLDVIENWQPGVHDDHPSLWDSSMTSMDVSNGATAFKAAILSRSHGLNTPLLSILKHYQTWLQSIEELTTSIEALKHSKWTIDLDAYDSDSDSDTDNSKITLLNTTDPSQLHETLEKALMHAITDLETTLQSCAAKFTPAAQPHQSLFLLRLIRELRSRLPRQHQNTQFGLALVPAAHDVLAERVLREPLGRLRRDVDRIARRGASLSQGQGAEGESKTRKGSRKVVMRALWEGVPELPVLPSVYVFRFSMGVVKGMAGLGGDIWSADAVQVVRRGFRAGVVPLFEDVLALEEGVDAEAGEVGESDDGVGRKGDDDNGGGIGGDGNENGKGADDWTIQTFFDVLFIQHVTTNATSTAPRSQNNTDADHRPYSATDPTATSNENNHQDQDRKGDSLDTLLQSLESTLCTMAKGKEKGQEEDVGERERQREGEEVVRRVRKAAETYWGRVQMLFGVLR